jgi:hypothetical protein
VTMDAILIPQRGAQAALLVLRPICAWPFRCVRAPGAMSVSDAHCGRGVACGQRMALDRQWPFSGVFARAIFACDDSLGPAVLGLLLASIASAFLRWRLAL